MSFFDWLSSISWYVILYLVAIISSILLIVWVAAKIVKRIKIGPVELSSKDATSEQQRSVEASQLGCPTCLNSEKFARLIITYQMEVEDLHDRHIEILREIDGILYRDRLKDQMRKAETQLEKISTRLLDNYLELVRIHRGENTNAVESAEYRNYESIIDLAVHDIRTLLRTRMIENHLAKLTDEQLKKWKKDAVDEGLATYSKYFNKSYPSEFKAPPASLVRESVDAMSDELRRVLEDAIAQMHFVAVYYEDKINALYLSYDKLKSSFAARWRSIIIDAFGKENPSIDLVVVKEDPNVR